MGKYLVLILLFLSVFSFSYAKNKVNANLGYGIYLSNSENSMKVMEDESFRSYLFYGLTFQRENLFGSNLMFEYNYHKSTKNDVMILTYTDETGRTLGDFGGDIVLINHNFDLDYFENINKYFSYGIGPSFVITNRIIDIDKYLYDKLASSGLGINCFLEFTTPLSKINNHFFVTSKLKFRYTYSIWFDEGLRKLDDYYQEFFSTQLSIGVGYSF